MRYMPDIKRTTKLQLIVFFSAYLVSHALFAADKLPEFSATYAIQKFKIKLAEAHYRLEHTQTGYRFTQNTELAGVAALFADDTVSAESLINISGKRLLLTKHRYIQTGREKNREDIDIQWQQQQDSLHGVITGTVRGSNIQLETDTEIWEALSFQIPLMIEADGETKEYPYKAILKGKIDTYNFVLSSTTNIEFAGKQYQALELIRRDPQKDRQLHLWLLPDLHNIPVIVENYRDGELHSRMQLESLRFGDAEPLIATGDNTEDEF